MYRQPVCPPLIPVKGSKVFPGAEHIFFEKIQNGRKALCRSCNS